MNTSSMNIHRVLSVAARVEHAESADWIALDFVMEDDSRFSLAAFSKSPEALLSQLSDGFAKGIEAAAALLAKKADEYDAEHGSTDPETGTREYPGRGAGADYYNSLLELAEDIRAIASMPSPA